MTAAELIESTANMMRGMCMDPRIPGDTKEALWSRVKLLDEAAEAGPERDTELLDFLQSTTTGYGAGWILRKSYIDRGMRLHETEMEGAKKTVREAISEAMNKERQ